MAEVAPLSVKNEDVIGRALRVIGRVGNRFIAKLVESRLSGDQSWVDLVRLRDDEKHRKPQPEDPATVLRALADAEYLPGLLAGSNAVDLPPMAKTLQQIRNDVIHQRVVFSEDRTRDALRKIRSLVYGLGGEASDLGELDRLEGNLGGHYGQGGAIPVVVPDPSVAETIPLTSMKVRSEQAEPATALPGTVSPATPAGDTATVVCKGCSTAVSPKVVLCPACGRNPRQSPPSPDPELALPAVPAENTAHEMEHAASSTVTDAAGLLLPAAVTVTLPNHTHIEVEVGQRLVLGRESPDSRVAQAFAGFEDVSRSHVRFINDEQGPALVMLGDTGGQYGTFLDGRQLPNVRNERVPLKDGDRIRLGEQQAWCVVKVNYS